MDVSILSLQENSVQVSEYTRAPAPFVPQRLSKNFTPYSIPKIHSHVVNSEHWRVVNEVEDIFTAISVKGYKLYPLSAFCLR